MISRIDFSPSFDKCLKKAPIKVAQAFANRLAVFEKDPYNTQLKNHALKGKLANYRSINVTGDWRALYITATGQNNTTIVIFEALGTHSQLY